MDRPAQELRESPDGAMARGMLVLRSMQAIGTAELLQSVAARAGVSIAIADRLLPGVLHALGRHLVEADRQLVAGELPPALGALLMIDVGLPLPKPAGMTEARVRAFVTVVCNVLIEGLSPRACCAVRSSAPAALVG